MKCRHGILTSIKPYWIVCDIDEDPLPPPPRQPDSSEIFSHSTWFPRSNTAGIFSRGLAGGICRQVRAETAHIHLKNAIFHFNTVSDYLDLVKYLSSGQLKTIRTISIARLFKAEAKAGGLSYWYRGIKGMAELFPALERVFMTPSLFDEDWTVESVRDLMAKLAGGEITGVEVVIMNVIDRKADMATAKAFKI